MRKKIFLAYALMILAPLLLMVCLILRNMGVPCVSDPYFISFVMVLVSLVFFSGYFLIRRVIGPLFKLAEETKKIARPEYDPLESSGSEEHLGDLAANIFSIKSRMRGYVEQLKNYSKRTSVLNKKIQKNLLTLTNLMGMADMISEQTKFQKITDYVSRKMLEELGVGFCGVYLKSDDNTYILSSFSKDTEWEVDEKKIPGYLPLLEKKAQGLGFVELRTDAVEEDKPPGIADISPKSLFVVHPISRGEDVFGMLVIVNPGIEKLLPEDKEMIEAFGKMLRLVAERSSQSEGDLYGRERMSQLLGSESISSFVREDVTRSVLNRKPCSLMYVSVDTLEDSSNVSEKGKSPVEVVTSTILRMIPEAAKVARDIEAGILVSLPGVKKTEALVLAEHMRSAVNRELGTTDKEEKRAVLSIGIAEEPEDGIEPGELIEKAELFMTMAKSSGADRIVSGSEEN